MRKQTKIAAGISAAALVAVAGAMTSLAATGWVNEGGSWYYYNASGDYVTDTWKSYNGQYFYLGDEGEMWTNRLIEDGDNHYYVDANGAMVKNTWVAVPADEDEDLDVEYRWYYFGSTGKAYRKSYGKTINGKKYGFDDEGKMLFGYVAADSYEIKNDDDDPILNADYYYGTNEDGARHTGWLQYADALTDKDDDYYWFYFNTSNGKKVFGQSKTINGKKYTFDSQGIMNKEWKVEETASSSTASDYDVKWYNKLEDGSLAKNKWIWNKPYEADSYNEVDSDGVYTTKEDYDDETPRWFRTDASGNIIKGRTKKVNSKWYVFDSDGVMRTGLVILADEDGAVSGGDGNYLMALDMDNVTKANLKTLVKSYGFDGRQIHYFSEDEEKDGSMKTGTIKIELADDEYTFCFTKTTGAAKDGYDSSNKKVYNCGILEKAGDDKYKVVKDERNSVDYLVGSTGSVVKTVSTYKDANDNYYVYLASNSSDKFDDDYNWYIGKTSNETVAKYIKNHKSSYTVDFGNDVISVTDGTDTYTIDLVGVGSLKTK